MQRPEPVLWSKESLGSPHEIADKAGRVRRMFDAIAPRYGLVNSLFSLGLDQVWRRRAIALANVESSDIALDVACGTGDLAAAVVSAGCSCVIGCDFSHEMILRAAARCRWTQAVLKPQWCEADALALPFQSGRFTLVACAFGVRNFQELNGGLSEMFRVLKPGGRAVILEFGRVDGKLTGPLFRFYSERFMPWAASRVSGDRTGAYRYLPRSVRSFPSGESFVERLRTAGFARIETTSMTSGIVMAYVAWRN